MLLANSLYTGVKLNIRIMPVSTSIHIRTGVTRRWFRGLFSDLFMA